MKMKILFCALIFSSTLFAKDDLRDRYRLNDLYSKIVDNRGNGEERLYGVRNARLLFKNILRGGANNYYHRTNARSNTNPLPEDGLLNLCQEGFTSAIYLYETNFSTASKNVRCETREGGMNTLQYFNYPYSKSDSPLKALTLVHQHLTDNQGSLYIHCWNGWHASGYISAISLIQFCGWNATDAVTYWDRNTDGVNTDPGYESIRKKIRNFKVFPELQISDELKKEFCVEWR
jgi:hypothetical protein